MEILRERKEKIVSFYKLHEHKVPAAFFIGGFLFDIFTLGRIDSMFSILQQAAYLLVLSVLLILELAEKLQRMKLEGKLARYFEYHEAVVHFIFGSLLSTYTLFFFKSASFATSIVFMAFIGSLLILNELPKFQKFGLLIRFALLSLCLSCYFAYVIPIVMGFGGFIPFALSLVVSMLWMGTLYWILMKRGYPQQVLKKSVMLPALTITAAFVTFYVFQLIPPVPVALNNIGIYHKAERQDDNYLLTYYRPWWKFWQNGAQTFLFREGDKITCFFNIFSPNNFKDNVKIHWYFKDPRQGWVSTDAIPVGISGGRDDGFRGIAIKSNFQMGKWQVRVETEDNREIGRLNFEVVQDDSTEERIAKQDIL